MAAPADHSGVRRLPAGHPRISDWGQHDGPDGGHFGRSSLRPYHPRSVLLPDRPGRRPSTSAAVHRPQAPAAPSGGAGGASGFGGGGGGGRWWWRRHGRWLAAWVVAWAAWAWASLIRFARYALQALPLHRYPHGAAAPRWLTLLSFAALFIAPCDQLLKLIADGNILPRGPATHGLPHRVTVAPGVLRSRVDVGRACAANRKKGTLRTELAVSPAVDKSGESYLPSSSQVSASRPVTRTSGSLFFAIAVGANVLGARPRSAAHGSRGAHTRLAVAARHFSEIVCASGRSTLSIT